MDIHERESKKVIHIMVLLCSTILSFAMIGHSIAHGERPAAAALLMIGLVLVYTPAAVIRKLRRERKKAESTISRLEEDNRSAEDFLANVSHELRAPINTVTGVTAAMLKREEDAEKRENLLSVQMAGNQLFNRLEDILDYLEIDTGGVQVSEETYTIPSLINDVIAENQLMKRHSDVELTFDIDPRIPAALLGDGKKIKKIIKHLTDNAVKFTKKGGAHIRIYALRKAYGINLCIRVSNTDVGILGEELKKITEKYLQPNGGRIWKSGGLGLGLPIVYGLVTAMGGFVRVESTEGVGTVVSVSIPQKVADASPRMEVHGLERKGFRVEDGLRYCNHNIAFYEETLLRFAREAEDKIAQLEAALRKEELKTYQILTHTLKSSAKTVGAVTLAEMAKNAEEAAKSRDAGYVHERHGALLDQYREMARCICDALSPAEEAVDGKEISKTELLRYLLELRETLGSCESGKAEALLAEVSGFIYQGTPVRGLLQGIRRDVDDFEWASASEKTESLIGKLEGGEVFWS